MLASEALASVKKREAELKAKEDQLCAIEDAMMAKQERLHSQMQAEMKAKQALQERYVEDIISKFKAEVNKPGSILRIEGEALENLRVERDPEAEAEYAAQQKRRLIPGALTSSDVLSPGDRVVVLARTHWYGFKGRVQRLTGGSNGVPVRAVLALEGSNSVVELDKTELGRAPSTDAPPKNGKVTAKRDYSKVVSSW